LGGVCCVGAGLAGGTTGFRNRASPNALRILQNLS
jgi:hypothetical protein